MRQSDHPFVNSMAIIGMAVLLVSSVVGCVKKEVDETTLGTIGKAAVTQTFETVRKSLYDRAEAERKRMATELAAEEIAHATTRRALELREQRLARQARVEDELRRELDDLKANREILHVHLERLAATQGADDNCPLGDANHIRVVLDWLRDQPAGHQRGSRD